MTSEARTMLWNFTLGYPLFRAKMAREDILLAQMERNADALDQIAEALRKQGLTRELEVAADREHARYKTISREVDAVFRRSTGNWSDLLWLMRHYALNRSARAKGGAG